VTRAWLTVQLELETIFSCDASWAHSGLSNVELMGISMDMSWNLMLPLPSITEDLSSLFAEVVALCCWFWPPVNPSRKLPRFESWTRHTTEVGPLTSTDALRGRSSTAPAVSHDVQPFTSVYGRCTDTIFVPGRLTGGAEVSGEPLCPGARLAGPCGSVAACDQRLRLRPCRSLLAQGTGNPDSAYQFQTGRDCGSDCSSRGRVLTRSVGFLSLSRGHRVFFKSQHTLKVVTRCPSP